MGIDGFGYCKCDECRKGIDVDFGEKTICYNCYRTVLDNIESLKEKVQYLENIIEEARDE